VTISPDYRRRLVIMVKEPRAGRVKTRLGRDLGMTAAAWWFRHQALRLVRDMQDPRWETILAVSPDSQGLTSRIWPAHLPRWPQGRGDLGVRMRRAVVAMPPGPVIIIGADIPGITRVHIRSAFQTLGHRDTVIGPATDGGYWLIGFARKRPPRRDLFSNVRWSTEHTLQDTLTSLDRLTTGFVETLRDVDNLDDLNHIFRTTPDP